MNTDSNAPCSIRRSAENGHGRGGQEPDSLTLKFICQKCNRKTHRYDHAQKEAALATPPPTGHSERKQEAGKDQDSGKAVFRQNLYPTRMRRGIFTLPKS